MYLFLVALTLVSSAHASDLNAYVLQAIETMPAGGGYATNEDAGRRFIDAIRAGDTVSVDADRATPSFCTTATYLVFTKVVERLQREGALGSVPQGAVAALAPPPTTDSLYHDDGVGVWGRWNANGPGTAKFFHDSGLGANFESLSRARAGDFMKAWWTDEVGGRERGHSVVYLGARKNPETGQAELQYWSSNQAAGYTRKWVKLATIKHRIFSRLENPEALRNLPALPRTDAYLQSCQSIDSSFDEAKAKSGVAD